MPKTGKSNAEWKCILRKYAAAKIKFTTRQRPRPGTYGHDQLKKLEQCPSHNNTTAKDITVGKRVKCNCGYHSLLPQTTIHSSESTPSSTDPQGSSSISVVSTTSSTGQAPIYSERPPKGWHKNMPEADRSWIGRHLFIGRGKLVNKLKLWWHPPTNEVSTSKPNPEAYFLRRLFLWMPRLMWKVDFKCTHCKKKQSLWSKGVYNNVRLVIDTKDYYYIAAEYMECPICHHTYISWSHQMLDQLADEWKSYFPAVLTRKYACDKTIISMLRSRTQGNSPSALRNKIKELHSEEWLSRQLRYLTDCERHQKGLVMLREESPSYELPPPFPSFPSKEWFLAVYTRDVWSRLPSLLAAATSVYGSILKLDSTKKVCKKLQGYDANTASWATNVGNERGEVLVSVLTDSESIEGLQKMADGLMDRYEKADEDPPKVIYTDRDCCYGNGPSKLKTLFRKWKDVHVRLDVWHFMRRIAGGCTSESHPLYGIFMSKLSSCIFEWDENDYDLLIDAKLGELRKAGVSYPSFDAARNAITLRELTLHCRRRTRGIQRTTELIESLILTMTQATDPLGVPILREEMKEIWMEQKKHITCLQDPPGVTLYTITGHITKGGVQIQTLRCARGTTSLESFHLHLSRFIPGTSASAVHYQAYLLDGLTRWNAARSAAAIESSAKERDTPRTFNFHLQHRVNQLSESLFGTKVLPMYQALSKYTGELYGAEYLYAQSGQEFNPDLDEEVEKGLEGVEDEGFEDGTIASLEEEESMTLKQHEHDNNNEEYDQDNVIDSRGIGGWDKVDQLARVLLDASGLAISNSQAAKIKECFDQLHEFDKKPLTFKQVAKRPQRGRFARTKSSRSGHIGIMAMKRCFLSAGSPAASPAKSRVVEAICIHLCDTIASHQRKSRQRSIRYTSRWDRILSKYNSIRSRVLNSAVVLEGTTLALYPINKATLLRWYKNTTRRDEIKMLMQGLNPPTPRPCSFLPLPPAKRLCVLPPEPPQQPHEFPLPEDTSGQAKVRNKGSKTTASSVQSGSSSSASTESSTVISQMGEPSSSATTPSTSAVVKPPSRTTVWRQKKAAALAAAAESSSSGRTDASTSLQKLSKTPRKEYTCRVCGETMRSSGHTQFRGQRYCPKAPGQIPKKEWLAKKKEEAQARAAQKAEQSSNH